MLQQRDGDRADGGNDVMTAFARPIAIVKADFLIRFRRPSTVVLFLLICSFAYLWVPDPSTGRALMQIEGRRALYNSAAIGMATALIGTIFVGLVGFYVVSNAIGRDVTSRCGSIIASTEVRTSEYLVGKFIGNVVFLAVFLAGFMLSSMAMLLVRGEAPLQVGTFVGQYLLLIPPSILFVSAIAVLFESVPFLSGRGGDVIYFFVWTATLGSTAAVMATTGAKWPRYFDHSGFIFVIEQLQRESGTASLSIGSSPFDPSIAPVVFEGLRLTREWVLPRLVSLVSPLALLVLARLAFHRFDPTRIRAGGNRSRIGLPGRLMSLVRPLSRIAAGAPTVFRTGSAAAQGWVDALHTLALSPVAILALIALVVMSFTAARPFSIAALASTAVLGVVLADVPCRDARRGTLALLYSSPRLREQFVPWKAASMAITSILFLLPVLVRTAVTRPAGLAPLAVGIVFMVAVSLFLGVVGRNPKAFIVVFLSFWYLAVNDKGITPTLDFAGLYGKAPPQVTAAYLVAGALALVAAHFAHRRRLAVE